MSREDPHAAAGRLANPRMTLVQTAGTQERGTSHLVQSRLRFFAGIVLSTILIWLVRGVFLAESGHLVLQSGGLLAVGAMAAPLALKHQHPRVRLRMIELGLLVLTVVQIAAYSYLVVAERVAAAAELLALAQIYNSTIALAGLIVIYGVLIPNTWQRAALVVGSLAAAPVLGLVALRIFDAELYRTLQLIVSRETIVDLGLALVVAATTATVVTESIYALRREARDARSMGQYELQERIAEGGMGEIWRARHRFLARPAAVKVIQPDKVDPLDREAAAHVLERFEREAQATATLESLHTVRVYDFGRTDAGEFYYAMELLNGFDVEQLIDRYGPIAPARAVHLLVQVCDSLAEAHELGQVHRDIKPSNLFLCKVGLAFDVIKVLDFGLVTRAGSEECRDARLQEEGMAGTPAYMAPEQVLAVTTIDERADIYALGCVAYWMLTGHTLFDIDRPIAMAVAHVKAPPMPPSRRTEMAIPPDLENVIMQCLEKDPARRPATAEQLSSMLLACDCGAAWGAASAREWWGRHRPLERRAS